MAGNLLAGFAITGTVTGGVNTTCTITRAITMYDATLTPLAGTGGGQTVTVTSAGGAFTEALACAAAETIARPALLTNANAPCAAASVLTFTNSGTAIGTCNAHCTMDGSAVPQ